MIAGMDAARPEEAGGRGRRIIQASWAGTALFAVTAILAALILGPIRYVAVAVSMGLFVLGCLVFFWAYATAVQRSRTEELGIGGLFFLAGPTAPSRPRLLLNGSLATQIVVALATASARPYTTLAFGILVPLYGIACTGLWGARYGTFGPRQRPDVAEPAEKESVETEEEATTADPSPTRRRGGTERAPAGRVGSHAERGGGTEPEAPAGRLGRAPGATSARMHAMAEAATKTITIAAPPEACYEIVAGFEQYPEWVTDIVDARVLERDPTGRPLDVAFIVSALGRNTRYTLRYDYAGAPALLSWELVEGDIMRAIDGFYRFDPSNTLAGGTDVTYDLSIELVVPMPGFLKRRAEARILNTVHHLKSRAEG